MIKVRKNFKIFAMVMLAIMLALSALSTTAYAATDSKTALHGFDVDSTYYDIVWRYNTNTNYDNAYKNGVLVGRTYSNIGRAVAKDKVDGKYAITYMIYFKTSSVKADFSQKVLWWTDKWSEYGFNKNVEIDAALPAGTTLVKNAPKYVASDTTYSFSVGVGVDKSGPNAAISAGVSFTSGAVGITDSSSTVSGKIKTKIYLNESVWRWDWGRYKYAAQENTHLMAFTVLSNSNKPNFNIKITSAYGTQTDPSEKVNWWTDIHSGTYSTSYSYVAP